LKKNFQSVGFDLSCYCSCMWFVVIVVACGLFVVSFGGHAQDALRCSSLSTKEPLIMGRGGGNRVHMNKIAKRRGVARTNREFLKRNSTLAQS